MSVTATSARLPGLNPGQYVVQLTVTNDGGVTSYQEATINASDNSDSGGDISHHSDDVGENTALIAGLVASLLIVAE